MEEAGEEVDETVRDNFYVRRLEKGLSTLQLADAAVLLLITAHIPPVQQNGEGIGMTVSLMPGGGVDYGASGVVASRAQC